MKTLPRFLVEVLKALQETSIKFQHKLLDWETVLMVTRKTLAKYEVPQLAGIQIFAVVSLLNYLGTVRAF